MASEKRSTSDLSSSSSLESRTEPDDEGAETKTEDIERKRPKAAAVILDVIETLEGMTLAELTTFRLLFEVRFKQELQFRVHESSQDGLVLPYNGNGNGNGNGHGHGHGSVVLTGVRDDRELLIARIRSLFGVSRDAALTAIADAPTTIAEHVDARTAIALQQSLVSAGGDVEIS